MGFDDIRQKIANELCIHPEWGNKLADTETGNYGVRDWEVSLDNNNIWIEDIKLGTFTFKKVGFEFTVILGESNDGLDHSHSTIANGRGKFIIDKGSLTIKELDIDCDLDLMV